MYDRNRFDPDGFMQYLLDNMDLGPLKERFMEIWVRKSFQLIPAGPGYGWSDQLPLYPAVFDRSYSFQPWQIRQADQAVRLYFTRFLGCR